MLIWLNLALFVASLAAIIWAREVSRRAQRQTRQDAVTGALSRAGFIEVLEDESKRARRHLHPITVAYVDLDDFKLVNDVLGHETGNSVLQVVGRTMQSTLREVDFVARLGGDEFALLLAETRGEDIRGVLNKLQETLLEAMKARGWRVTFSLGAVTFNDPPAAPEEMIAKADELMYSVKLTGKNRTEHSILDNPSKAGCLVRCARCRTSFTASSRVCPVCRGTTLLDLRSAEHYAHTQRGVQAYITNLEGELTGAVRSLETILDILTEAGRSEHSRHDGVLQLFTDDLQKIASAVGAPGAFTESNGAERADAPLLVFKQRVSELRGLALTRKRSE